MTVLLDTNVILDYLLKRKGFFEYSARIFQLAFSGEIIAFITASSCTDLFYIVSKTKNKQIARELLKNLLFIVDVLEVNKEIIINALNSSFEDFENAVQSFSASFHNLDFIITRNIKDFDYSDIPILSPEDFVNKHGFKFKH